MDLKTVEFDIALDEPTITMQTEPDTFAFDGEDNILQNVKNTATRLDPDFDDDANTATNSQQRPAHKRRVTFSAVIDIREVEIGTDEALTDPYSSPIKQQQNDLADDNNQKQQDKIMNQGDAIAQQLQQWDTISKQLDLQKQDQKTVTQQQTTARIITYNEAFAYLKQLAKPEPIAQQPKSLWSKLCSCFVDPKNEELRNQNLALVLAIAKVPLSHNDECLQCMLNTLYCKLKSTSVIENLPCFRLFRICSCCLCTMARYWLSRIKSSNRYKMIRLIL